MDKFFKISERGSTVGNEVIGGLTTFLAMAYIIAVNPTFLQAAGIPFNAALTATCFGAAIMTAAMGLIANRPLALASGMGINAIVAFTLCDAGGLGIDWRVAMAIVFLEGVVILVLVVCGLRKAIMDAIPVDLRITIGIGIGLFIAFIGLKGGGIVVDDPATLVNLGDITGGAGLLSVIGLVITGALVIFNVPGALLIGIIATAVIGIPMGLTQFHGFVDTPPSMKPILCQFSADTSQIFSLDMLIVVFTFLFVDMFDTIGTLVGVTTKANMVEKDGRPLRMNKAFMADAIGTVAGACLGTSTVTTYVESASGVAQGGRSGLTAFSVAACFVLALFFAPVFTAIPGSAVCPALVFVGLFMLSPIKDIPLDDFSESIPAFLTMILMPMTYSISNGILLGLVAYVILNLCTGKVKKIGWFMAVLSILVILKFIFL